MTALFFNRRKALLQGSSILLSTYKVNLKYNSQILETGLLLLEVHKGHAWANGF